MLKTVIAFIDEKGKACLISEYGLSDRGDSGITVSDLPSATKETEEELGTCFPYLSARFMDSLKLAVMSEVRTWKKWK